MGRHFRVTRPHRTQSVEAARGSHPLGLLVGDCPDGLGVLVAVEFGDSDSRGRRGGDEVGRLGGGC